MKFHWTLTVFRSSRSPFHHVWKEVPLEFTETFSAIASAFHWKTISSSSFRHYICRIWFHSSKFLIPKKFSNTVFHPWPMMAFQPHHHYFHLPTKSVNEVQSFLLMLHHWRPTWSSMTSFEIPTIITHECFEDGFIKMSRKLSVNKMRANNEIPPA